MVHRFEATLPFSPRPSNRKGGPGGDGGGNGSGPTDAGPSSDPSGVDPGAILRSLEGDQLELRTRLLSRMEGQELRPSRSEGTEAYREEVLRVLRTLARDGWGSLAYPQDVGGGGDTRAAVKVFETLAYGDLSVLVKFGVHFGLFGVSILQLGSDRHRGELLPQVSSLERPGCFAMTERAHGSNVRELRTTAEYDPVSQEFEIHTPDPGAAKDWIGNAAAHGQLATVFARLRTLGEDYGVHAFIVPLRDESGHLQRGVHVVDRGEKVGLNGVDNGSITFQNVRVPRTSLLDRFASVHPDGTYESSIEGEGRRFFTMLGTLVAGRISVAAASVSASKTALTIAVRYGNRRRQFGPPGEPQLPLLDYRAHQRLLLPRLATTYGLHFAVDNTVARYADRPDRPPPEVEVQAAALKAAASRHAMETIQACREACGGEGYAAANRFGTLRNDVDVFTTFEGTNTVLLQLVAKGLLTEYRDLMGDLSVWRVVREAARRAGSRLQRANPVTARKTDEAHLRDPNFHREVFRFREQRLLHTLARRLHERISGGMDPFRAANDCQDHLLAVGRAHADRLVVEAFQEAVARAATPALSDLLGELATLHALTRMEEAAGWYLESGVMEGGKTKAVRELVNRLCGDLREWASPMVDGFGIPDRVLDAPAGMAEPAEDPPGQLGPWLV